MKKKTILITGSNGFIGSNLTNKLKNLNKYTILEFNHEDGDIASHKFDLPHLDHVIHLAGKTYVPDSWEDPYSFYKTIFLGTVNILELCRTHKASLTYVSSYVYGQPDYLPIDEGHPLKAANPYMDSKIQAESVCSFYANNYDIPAVIFRPFNIFGPGQPKHFIIPKIIQQVIYENDEINVFSLNTKRDYLYIDDLTDALVLSLDLTPAFHTINIGSGLSYSPGDIIALCQQIAGTDKKIVSDNIEWKNEIVDVVADISRARKVLNWNPIFSLKQGLEKIIHDDQL